MSSICALVVDVVVVKDDKRKKKKKKKRKENETLNPQVNKIKRMSCSDRTALCFPKTLIFSVENGESKGTKCILTVRLNASNLQLFGFFLFFCFFFQFIGPQL